MASIWPSDDSSEMSSSLILVISASFGSLVTAREPDMLAISATMTSAVTLMAGRRRYSISRNPNSDYLTVQIKCGSGCGDTCGPWR